MPSFGMQTGFPRTTDICALSPRLARCSRLRYRSNMISTSINRHIQIQMAITSKCFLRELWPARGRSCVASCFKSHWAVSGRVRPASSMKLLHYWARGIYSGLIQPISRHSDYAPHWTGKSCQCRFSYGKAFIVWGIICLQEAQLFLSFFILWPSPGGKRDALARTFLDVTNLDADY